MHGNRIVSDSTTIVSFSISGGPGTILPPRFARADSGRVLGRVQPTGPQGNVLVFAGASGLSPSTFEIPVRQAQPPRFTSDTFELEIVEDGSPVYLALGALVEDIDSASEDLTFSLEGQMSSIALSIEDQQLVAAPALCRLFWDRPNDAHRPRPHGLRRFGPAANRRPATKRSTVHHLRTRYLSNGRLALFLRALGLRSGRRSDTLQPLRGSSGHAV